MKNPRTGYLSPMRPRNPEEQHRAASPLELFFDLVFVVAVSFSSVQFHHMSVEGHLGSGLLGYLMVFFAIWWSWMNFTWFATSFDTDDWLYRILTFVQMTGVLVLASGAAAAMEDHDFTMITIGYVIMRLALVSQWIRAAANNPELRTTAIRYALGIAIVQAAWIARLFLPETAGFIGFFVLVIAEIAVPVWAESHRATPWNTHHITERYGLFTLILLGESILASANAVVESLHTTQNITLLLMIAGSGLVTAAGMWWIYFSREHHTLITSLRSSLTYGYFHYLIFAAAGAFSVGIEVAIDQAAGESKTTGALAAATLTLPVAVFIIGIWLLVLRSELSRAGNIGFLAGVCVILLGMTQPSILPVAITTLGTVICVVVLETGKAKHPSTALN